VLWQIRTGTLLESAGSIAAVPVVRVQSYGVSVSRAAASNHALLLNKAEHLLQRIVCLFGHGRRRGEPLKPGDFGCSKTGVWSLEMAWQGVGINKARGCGQTACVEQVGGEEMTMTIRVYGTVRKGSGHGYCHASWLFDLAGVQCRGLEVDLLVGFLFASKGAATTQAHSIAGKWRARVEAKQR
jgi:hypothetical protein